MFSFLASVRKPGAAFTAAAVFVIIGSFWFWTAFSDESVNLSATVGIMGVPPSVTSVTPALDPITVAKNSAQTISLSVEDSDSAEIMYTITAGSGVTIPQNGTVPLVSGSAYVDFTYYAPTSKARLVPITVTLDDGSGRTPIVKVVNVYVY